MKKSDIEMLSAYLDNELEDAERQNFEERLAKDKDLADAFAKYSSNDQSYKHAFTAIDETPIPNSILSLLAESEKEISADSQKNIVELKNWHASKWMPIAASLLIFAVSLPLFFKMSELDSPTLATVLNSQSSGQTIELDGSITLNLVMSFNDQQGHFCREYIFTQPNNSEQRVACKIDGMWQTQVIGKLEMVNGNHYQAAGSAGSEQIESWLDANMSGIPFGLETEQEILESLALEQNGQ